MTETKKNKLYFIATIAFLLLSVDFVTLGLISDSHIKVCCDCPDFSKNAGHSHHHAFEKEVLHREARSIQYRPEISNGFIPTMNLLICDSYCSKVWQPPKIS